MKAGFDQVHDYPRRMELALKKLRQNKKVNLHNRLKIQKFLDYLETQQVSTPRRIRYAQNLTKLASMLEKDLAHRSKICNATGSSAGVLVTPQCLRSASQIHPKPRLRAVSTSFTVLVRFMYMT